MISVHPKEMLFDVVGSVKLFLADVTMERLLLSVDGLVARVQVPPIRRVRARAAAVPLAYNNTKTVTSTNWGAFDSAKNHKRQRRKRQSVTAKREKSQTPKFVYVRLS